MRFGPRLVLAFFLVVAATASGGAPADAPAADDAAAVVGKDLIPWSLVETTAGADLEHARRDHDSQLRRLELQSRLARAKVIEGTVDRLLDERVLALEGAATGRRPDSLLETVKVAPVADTDLRAFYAEHKDQITKPFDAVAAQIREYLETDARHRAERAYLTQLRAKYHAESRVPPLRIDVAADGPARGAAAAPVTVVEFGDFQCPYCAEMEPVLKSLAAAYPTELRLVFRHLPLVSIHPLAADAARAAVCADRQGRFWDIHDAFYANQSALGLDAIKATAARLGLDPAEFDRCIGSDEPDAKVAADSAAADAIGIGGTPAFLINGRFQSGTNTLEAWRTIIDDELRRVKAQAASPARKSAAQP